MVNKNQSILILTHEASPRLSYALDFIFSKQFLYDYTIIHKAPVNDAVLVIEYGDKATLNNTVFIPKSKMINLGNFDPKWNSKIREFGLSKSSSGLSFNIDIFSEIFFHLSRMEEYEFDSTEELNRFSVKNSSVNDLVLSPFLDFMIQQFVEGINAFWKIDITRNSQYTFIHTIDIDQFYSYKAKGIKRSFGGFGRDILKFRFGIALARLLANAKSKDDPYDTFDKLWKSLKTKEKYVFILQSQKGKFDKASNISHTEVKKIIQKISRIAQIGIHPGIETVKHIELIQKERNQLSKITNQKINISRQHYLNFHFPQTPTALIKSGIKHDFSLGFHDHIGFRAGTCHRFNYYDIENETVTPLTFVPTIAMDVTLKRHQNLSPKDAIETIKKLINACKSVSGAFCLLWHNSSFDVSEGWLGWDKVYKEIVKYADDQIV